MSESATKSKKFDNVVIVFNGGVEEGECVIVARLGDF